MKVSLKELLTNMLASIKNKQDKLNRPLYLVQGNVKNWNDATSVGWYSGYNASNGHSDWTNEWVQVLVLLQNNNPDYPHKIAFTNGHIYSKYGGQAWIKIV